MGPDYTLYTSSGSSSTGSSTHRHSGAYSPVIPATLLYKLPFQSSIRETILKMLGLNTLPKGSTLPAPPPSGVRAPTQDRFYIRWDQTEKTPFNKIAAGLVIQEMCNAEPNSLTAEEVKQLPKLVEQHIRYLCRRYKNENREDAGEFNAKRLKRCSANSRKQTTGS
ncbi:hypothetical protein FRC08_013531 [Ceratobasidium sp. 394]|nr:hypothetical protein FRC08_013531 [Ceratobasidium sp. 394]